MKIEELIRKLQRPMFVWQMARPARDDVRPGSERGRKTRLEDAEIGVDRIALAYAADRLQEHEVHFEELDGQGWLPFDHVLAWLRSPTLPEEEKTA